MRRILLALLGLTLAYATFASDAPLLLQHPTLSETKIVFAYGGDLWSVSREGGVADRLTAGTGTKSRPTFSPDGSEIAFTANYDGNLDVYVIPATGGVPRRLTWHPAADNVVGWTRDGKQILFTSNRTSDANRYTKLF